MNDLDWQETYNKYVRYLPRASNREEFNELVSHMVGELGAGHTSIGNMASRTQDSRSGTLGAEFNDDKGLYVTEIYDGDIEIMEQRSPLSIAEPRVDVGDRIRRINEFPVINRYMLDRLLYDKVGQPITATVEKPNGSMVITRISPISAEREAWLRNRYWAFSNQRYVDRVSNSKVGYIHLGASYEADVAELVRQYSYQHNRSGIILDLRGNNGGNADPWILNFLQRRTWLYVQDRYDKMPLKHPRDSYEGKLVVLIDGDTYSDGELIAEGIRRLHLGTLVGSRTSGAGVWVNDDQTLIDGTRVRIPVSGSYLAGKKKREWIIEGSGVQPDILVENDPYYSYFDHDTQLEAAIKVAIDE
jgi:tricorn protease